MEAQTIWRIVHDEGGHRLLWTIDVSESKYRCRTWPLDDDDLALLTSWTKASEARAEEVPEPEFLANPDSEETFDSVADAYAFFATEYDPFLRSHAWEFLGQIDPVTYPPG